MNKIIIYGSKYGTAKLYAQKLSEEIGVSVKSFKEVENIDNYDIIIYLGALYAGGVLGMAKTLKKLNNLSNKNIIIATVGLADPTDSQNINNIRTNMKMQLSNKIIEKAKIFHLRGGIDYSKLNILHKTMMNMLYQKVKKMPEEEWSAEDKAMIETFNKKVNFVNFSNLKQIISEIEKIED